MSPKGFVGWYLRVPVGVVRIDEVELRVGFSMYVEVFANYLPEGVTCVYGWSFKAAVFVE